MASSGGDCGSTVRDLIILEYPKYPPTITITPIINTIIKPDGSNETGVCGIGVAGTAAVGEVIGTGDSGFKDPVTFVVCPPYTVAEVE